MPECGQFPRVEQMRGTPYVPRPARREGSRAARRDTVRDEAVAAGQRMLAVGGHDVVHHVA